MHRGEGPRANEELAKLCDVAWLCDCAPLLISLLAAQSDPLVWEWRPHVCSSPILGALTGHNNSAWRALFLQDNNLTT